MSLLHHACGLKNFSLELFAFLMGKRLLSTRKFNLSCSSWGCRVYLSFNSHTRLSQNQMGGWERWIPIENFTLPLWTLSILLERRYRVLMSLGISISFEKESHCWLSNDYAFKWYNLVFMGFREFWEFFAECETNCRQIPSDSVSARIIEAMHEFRI